MVRLGRGCVGVRGGGGHVRKGARLGYVWGCQGGRWGESCNTCKVPMLIFMSANAR